MLNGILAKFGDYAVPSTPNTVSGVWLSDERWQLIGYMMIIYIAGLQNVSPDLIEAAKIDGATKTQTLRRIIIPMVMPSFTICLFLTLTNSFKLFDQNLGSSHRRWTRKTDQYAGSRYLQYVLRQSRLGKASVRRRRLSSFLMVAVISLTQLYLTRRKEVEN